MDVEKTLELIAASQLRAEKQAEARAREAEERFAKADERADKADKRMDRMDKQIEATKNLVPAGMKMLQKLQKESEFKLNALIDSQARAEDRMRKFEERMLKFEQRMLKSDEKFDRLLAKVFGKRSNGHN